MIQRAAIYARYSSDSQREASIDDQIRLCREFVGRHDWTLVETFHDAAISGATGFRPGYQALIEAAKQGQFDVVVAEALDRLSRDQADVATLFKRLKFAGIRIVTLADGEVTELHVGLKGTMNALFLQDLAQKTHRGQRGRIEAGKSAGGLCYGYDVVRRLDERGEPIRGDRAINPAEAATRKPHLQHVCRWHEPYRHREGSQCRAHPRSPRRCLAGYDNPRPCGARHRHSPERTLHRTPRMEPDGLCPEP